MRQIGAIFLLCTGLHAAAYGSGFHFEPNRGQSGSAVQYLAHTRGGVVFLTDTGLALRCASPGEPPALLRIDFEGASPAAAWRASEPAPGTTSYLIGKDRRGWLRDVPHFARVVRQNLYPGISLAAYGSEGRLEYDFLLVPGADPAQIRLRFSGAGGLELTPTGDLVLSSASGKLVQKKPILYQTNPDGSVRPVAGSYRMLAPDRVAFVPGPYDPGLPLTIDPVLESATLLGGIGKDRVLSANPNAVVVGSTASADFPGVQAARHRGFDVFLYFPDRQSTLIIGGSGDDIVTSVSGGSSIYSGVLIGGYTNSRDFPVTGSVGGYNPTFTPQTQYGGGDWDGFVLYFYNAMGNLPSISSYLGGSGDDRVLAVGFSEGYWGSFAVAGSTTSTDFPLANPWQSAPGGGTDGFLTVIDRQGRLQLSTYLGGSGDDRALAVATADATDEIYVAGETRSSDWSLAWTGARNGPSDAFLLHGNTKPTYKAAEAALFGGSGDDRITAIAWMPNGNLAVAGATSSSDLPAPEGAQLAYAGGPSDVFLAQFSKDLQKVPYLAVLGGSGAEEPLAVATNRFNELAVAGWTNSTDFPLDDPLQRTYGGGDEDGFLLFIDSDGRRVLSTYYGGSAADRITSVRLDASQQVSIGGFTDSSDLPLKDPGQGTNAGSTDGFYASITVPLLHASGLTVGKDLAARGYAQLGDPRNHVGVPLTVTSSDPSRVLLATRPEDEGTPEITIASRAAANDLPGRSFLAYCLSDSGVVPVTLAAPGYASRTINVRCVPSGLSVGSSEIVVRKGSEGQMLWLVVVPAALDPDTGLVIQVQNPRAGLDPIRIDARSSDPSLVQCQDSVTLDQYSTLPAPSTSSYNSLAFSCQVKAQGTAEIAFTTGSPFAFVPSNRVVVRVSGPVPALYLPLLARGLVGPVRLSFSSRPGGTIPITLTSSDPSKVLITTNPALHGSPSVTVDYEYDFKTTPYLEALDAGDVSITATMPGFDPVTVPVRFVPLTAGFFNRSATLLAPPALAISDSVETYLRVYPDTPEGPSSSYFPTVAPGADPITLSVVNSTPSVASLDPSDGICRWRPTDQLGLCGPWTVKALAPGTTTISLKAGGASFAPALGSLSISVNGKRLSMTPVSVGNNLQARLGVTFEGRSPAQAVPITITSTDPSRLLLSADPQTPGQASITVSATWSVSVWAQALAGSGEIAVTASAEGYDSAQTTVTLLPSGLAWVKPSATLTAASGASVGIASYALDPANLAALAQQFPRPGLNGSIALQNSNPGAVTLDRNSLPLSVFTSAECTWGCPAKVALTPAGSGEAQISFAQPDGFTVPAWHPPLRVKVAWPVLALTPAAVGINLQTSTSVEVSRDAKLSPEITVTSADPARLLVSSSESDPGAASATLHRRQSGDYQPLFLQALNGPADVMLTATAPGLDPASSVVQTFPTAIVFESLELKTNTQAEPSALTLFPMMLDGNASPIRNQGTIRAGLDAIPVHIESSDPAVAIPQKSLVLLNALTSFTRMKVTPVAPGQASLSIVPPLGFVPPSLGRGNKMKVTVDGPAFVIPNLALGKNLQASVTLTVQPGASTAPADVDVVLASGDPFKVLLSATESAAGTGVLVVHFSAGQATSRQVYVQALDSSGGVAIQISAPGYRTTTTNVTLAPVVLSSSGSQYLTLGSDATFQLTPAPSGAPYYPPGYQFRPGLPEFTLNLSSSDTGVATLPSPKVAVSASARQIAFPIHPAGPGTAVVRFEAPGGEVEPGQLSVQVRGGQLSLSSMPTVGKDLQSSTTISGDGFYTDPVQVTVTSEDPSLLLVSASPNVPGQPSVSLTNVPGRSLRVYLQALAATGRVKVTVAAPGYQAAEGYVNLTSPAVVLAPISLPSLITPLSAPISFEARLTALSGYSDLPPTLRPGAAPVTVRAALSNPKIGSLSPSELVFSSGDSVRSFSFQPLAEGFALLTLSVPGGFLDPVAARQQPLNVSAARFSLSAAPSVGKDLRKSVSLRLQAPAAKPLSLTVTSLDPSRLLLATSVDAPGAPSITANFAAGSDTSASFGLIGLATAGSAGLKIEAPPLPETILQVALQPSGFRLNVSAYPLQVGGSSSATVLCSALNPQTLAPEGDFPLRAGISPVTVAVTSSDSQVLEIAPSALTFYPGDTQHSLTLLPKSAGSATLSIQTPPGFSTPSSGNKVNVNVR